MPASDKLTSEGHGKSCQTDTEDGSELIASLKFKNKQKMITGEKHKVRSTPQLKAEGSSLSRKMAKNLSSKKGRPKKPKNSNNSNPFSEGNASNDDVNVKKHRRRRKKRKRRKDLGELDEASRLQRRTRYLLIRMKMEQNLLDAYSGEGWKGQSREKIKPVKELLRAKKQILKCKLGIRDAIEQLDTLSSVGRIEESVIAPDGSIYHEHIFCAKCMQGEAAPDNDIILCDGPCNRGFHQKCLVPPLDSENIPPEDQGWFCKICNLKMEILDSVNAHLGTCFSSGSSWQEIFKEEAALSDAGIETFDQDDEWPSDDSKDDDYRAGTSNSSGDTSTSTSLSWSLDHEVLSESQKSEQEGTSYPYSSDEFTDADIIFGRRQRSAVDYKQLYNEMFGKDDAVAEQVSEDEDWGPTKRRRREKESDAANTLMTLHEGETALPRIEAGEADKEVPPEATQSKRTIFRIPLEAVERLRQVFAENELPSRSVRENLSKELGLHPEKVSKWFKNARYMALKTRKAERTVHNSDSPKACEEPAMETTGEKVADPVQLKDALIGTGTYSTDIPVAALEKEIELPSMVKTKKHKKGSFSSPANNNSNEVDAQLDENLRLKKHMKIIKSKLKKDKIPVESVSIDGLQKPEAELERLCRLKNRLENLKQRLLRYRPSKSKARGRPKLQKEPCVMYVPIAVVREKKA
ncbi:pathogenesis-related homeodomain protein [Punica granatum]|uniref:Pathogenesis-related homeodomain protein n=2 Tax=Punica granatum TaxID=22663 RepID=A0A6P8CN69_PUNGR|nr:pathogenesis-related homeodomain protein [Punica granatum]XP_031382791.1 pathogenesis-related homeodomain protein [Punica granatum]XP_031382792.1 pathogenesis-related homeodomain protein [Punica granatum]